MATIGPTELRALGERFGIHVDPDEADGLADRATGRLEALEPLRELSMPSAEGGDADRSWEEPPGDPLNAVAVTCDVSAPSGDGTELADLDVGVKDIVAVADVPMACGSTVMEGYVPAFDASVVERLLDAGAAITAKTSLDEFAGSPIGTTGARGPVRNPHDSERTAGGSSGGSAVAVQTGRVDAAIGSDTGGSIRIPAAFCGVVGLKPTWGLVPLHGVVENTYTQDHLGPLTPDVATAAQVLEVIAGRDERDPASLMAAGRPGYRVRGYVDTTEDPPNPSECTVGVLENGLGDGVSDTVETRFDACGDALIDGGVNVERVSVDGFEYGRAIKDALSLTELAAHWRAGGAAYRRGGLVDEEYQTTLFERSRSRSGELSDFYRAKLLAGARVIESGGASYTRAQAAREVLRERFDDVLASVDVLALPTMPAVAPRIEDAEDAGFDYARNTRAADLTRLPAISLPAGRLSDLPIGFQLMGGAFRERELLGIARTVESLLDDAS